jgi:hypothetical protein
MRATCHARLILLGSITAVMVFEECTLWSPLWRLSKLHLVAHNINILKLLSFPPAYPISTPEDVTN